MQLISQINFKNINIFLQNHFMTTQSITTDLAGFYPFRPLKLILQMMKFGHILQDDCEIQFNIGNVR